ncbi:hypothetical protein [Paraburkholderia caribensis]|uniref:hypothetical protein n=1 Tax=Paraburkholderia caribensis TaxID=75105 RepID=UPI0020901A69|nr:hypothetical protein [Paraburkholderia caribensis]MCO4880240.1 hypothetical protein [Paraburkholderia caribensis]
MNNIHIKRPFTDTLSGYTRQASERSHNIRGRSWPCTVVSVNGSIVTVQFQVTSQWTLRNTTMPVIGSEYIRLPIQPGMKGYAIPADTTLGAMSGLGPDAPPDETVLPGNLNSLVFAPMGNARWLAPHDPNKIELYGPSGFDIHHQTQPVSMVGSDADLMLSALSSFIKIEDGVITIKAAQIILDGELSQGTSGNQGGTLNGPIRILTEIDSPSVKVNGVEVDQHVHSNPEGGNVGPMKN